MKKMGWDGVVTAPVNVDIGRRSWLRTRARAALARKLAAIYLPGRICPGGSRVRFSYGCSSAVRCTSTTAVRLYSCTTVRDRYEYRYEYRYVGTYSREVPKQRASSVRSHDLRLGRAAAAAFSLKFDYESTNTTTSRAQLNSVLLSAASALFAETELRRPLQPVLSRPRQYLRHVERSVSSIS
jgi:hypothetical protein